MEDLAISPKALHTMPPISMSVLATYITLLFILTSNTLSVSLDEPIYFSPPSSDSQGRSNPTLLIPWLQDQYETHDPSSPSISYTDQGPTSDYSFLLSPPSVSSSSDTDTIQSPLSSLESSKTWTLPATFSDLSSFNVTHYASGASNLAILQGSPSSSPSVNPSPSASTSWSPSPNSLQILYPANSSNPSASPVGGIELYARPLDISKATNVTLEYSVFFPVGFDWVKGGKLPGLYGGHEGCSGGDDALTCFSTRMMWRPKGEGELYLYVPKQNQTLNLCSIPPKSVCDQTYGLSIARGSFVFLPGRWTTIRQDIWLNTPGVNDGGFNIWAEGRLVSSAFDVRYREIGEGCGGGVNVGSGGVGGGGDEDTGLRRRQQQLGDGSEEEGDGVPAAASNQIDQYTALDQQGTDTTDQQQDDNTPDTPDTPILSPSPSPLSALPSAASTTPPQGEGVTTAQTCSSSIGFTGLFFSTFFGGHGEGWQTPKDQYTYFKDFKISINA